MQTLNHLDPSCLAFRECSRELRRICGTKAILPASCTRSPQLPTIDPLPSAKGDCSDVYEGTLDDSKVCVKRVRVYTEEVLQKAAKVHFGALAFPAHSHQPNPQIICKEAVVWKRLSHPNVVPLLSITIAPLQFVSDWIPGGTLPEYIKNNPNADRLILVGFPCRYGILRLPQSPAIRRRQRPLLPPLFQCDPWRPQGSAWSLSLRFLLY